MEAIARLGDVTDGESGKHIRPFLFIVFHELLIVNTRNYF